MSGLTALQLAQRKHGIGSSDIAAVLGLNPYRNPLTVWLDKTGRAEAEQNDQADLGNDIEEVIARRAVKKLGLGDAYKDGTHVHPSEPWALATPDFRLGSCTSRRLAEIKNVGHRMLHHWGLDGTDASLPEYVLAQVHWQLGVVDGEGAHVAALLGGRDLVIIEVLPDAELFAAMLAVGREWWHKHVVADEQPAVDGHRATSAYLARRFARSNEAVIVPDEQQRAIALRLQHARAARLSAEKAEAKAEQAVKELMGEAAVLDLGEGQRITWRAPKQGRTAWKDVATEAGATAEMIEKHRSPPVRKFSCPRAWGADEGGDE